MVLDPTALRDARGAQIDRIVMGGGNKFIFNTHGFTLVAGADLPLHGFGDNTDGQLGLGSPAPDLTSMLMRAVEVEPTLIDLAAGSFHACAVDEVMGRRRVLCWGSGANGRLGNASERASDRPTPVFGYE